MPARPYSVVIAIALLAATVAFAQTDRYQLPGQSGRGAGANALQITGCNVDLIDDIDCPAPEEGIIVHLGVKEGSETRAEETIAQIDDRDSQQALKIAQYALEAADARANDDVERRYSQAAAKVAEAEVDEMREANERVEKAVSPAEIRRAKLEHDRAILGIEKAEKDQQLNALDANTKRAELAAAEMAVDRRRVLSPFDGQILEVYREQNEWVRPGDPIVRIARLDKLRVDGWVYFNEHTPAEVDGCEVTIQVDVGRGRIEKATGRVVYVSPLAEGFDNPKYRVRAEIANRRQQNRWLISPGLDATMTIHLGTGGARAAQR